MSYANKMGLEIDWRDFAATSSKQAIITQTPKEFDFPGISWPAHFHYTGPFHDNNGREDSLSVEEAQWQAVSLCLHGNTRERAGEGVQNHSSRSGNASGNSGCACSG